MKYCTTCRKQNVDTAKFCTGCGALLLSKTASVDSTPGQKDAEYEKHFGSSKNKIWIIAIIAILGIGAGVYFIFFNKKKNPIYEKTTSKTEQEAPSLAVDTTIVVPYNPSTIGVIQFKNHTKQHIFLTLSYPVSAPDDWRTFGWHEIRPGDTFNYKSECASPELYYFAKTSDGNKIWEGNDHIYVLPIDNGKKSFEYHTPVNPINYEKKPFVSIVYIDNDNWPLQVILE